LASGISFIDVSIAVVINPVAGLSNLLYVRDAHNCPISTLGRPGSTGLLEPGVTRRSSFGIPFIYRSVAIVIDVVADLIDREDSLETGYRSSRALSNAIFTYSF
jgi:hypothetical protein